MAWDSVGISVHLAQTRQFIGRGHGVSQDLSFNWVVLKEWSDPLHLSLPICTWASLGCCEVRADHARHSALINLFPTTLISLVEPNPLPSIQQFQCMLSVLEPLLPAHPLEGGMAEGLWEGCGVLTLHHACGLD